MTIACVVVPAHNEATTLGRLLTGLTADAEQNEIDIVVVCNGCSDDTADIARSFAGVRVIEVGEPSKRVALNHGDASSSIYPRLYVDADVELRASDVRALAAALEGTTHACAPRRLLDRDGCTPLVRLYYAVWEALPQVRSGLFGRGVIAMSAEGHARIAQLPPMMSDDLVISEAFRPDERRVVETAQVVVRPARTLRALIDRRVRVATGTAQADRGALRGDSSRTSLSTLLTLAVHSPQVAIGLPVFVAVTLIARRRAARRLQSDDFNTWLRDETSRAPTA